MPRRREKRTDTQNSDDFGEEGQNKERVTHFGSVQFNRLLAPDQIQGDDASKYSVRVWSNTLLAQRLLVWSERKSLFQRALSCLPYSYKIWFMYLTEFVDYCSTRSLISKQYKELNETFERALQKLPKMPRIWLMYSQALEKQQLISRTRSVYNWSFRNLPLTQHERIWAKFAEWAMKLDNSATAKKVVPRYLKLNPDFKQKYAQYLKEKQFYDESVMVIQDILKDEGYHSKSNKNKEDFFLELIEIIVNWPSKIVSTNGQQIIRKGIKQLEEPGKLWVKLSDYFIKLGQFDKARDSLEQALNVIDNAKDFGIIFNAYIKFEEEMITALADSNIRVNEQVVESDGVDDEIKVRLSKLESLIERQPYLLHKIALRKNPNNVKTWLKLAQLHESANNIEECINVLEKACNEIKPEQVDQGRFSQVWIKHANIYQNKGNILKCSEIMFQASNINYKMIEDYFNIWTRWAEMLLQEGYYEDALKVIKHVLFRKKIQHQPQEGKIKNIEELLKSHTIIWQLYIDLEITIGNFDSIKVAYQRCKQHRCLTPIMLINFTNFLWENTYFEEAFRVFEFAVGNFKWPSLYEIWIAYISKLKSRYSEDGIGIQRIRSIFERLLKEVPKEKSRIFYFMYAQFEQKHGLYSHAIQIYDRMIESIPRQQKYQAYCIYISKVATLLGITKTRAIFQTALQKLSEKQIIKMGLKYSQLECDLAEADRARGVYTYISQFTNPKEDNDMVWQTWQAFQVKFGDKDTYKQYLRIKRSVTAKFEMLPPDLQKIQQKIKKGLE